MKLYLLENNVFGAGSGNTKMACVVRANSVKEAREYAADEAEDEGRDTWLYHEHSSCEVIKNDGVEGVVISEKF